ncbi:hypothetical protein HBI56_084790 [Parastagonospora nodorum]|nr:hypothetical protein HBH56_101770 [Parastagonospora nodorum]KAH3929497.1 hypothetical protein HBH54_128660 [Parastagonospora nodorum]KAH3951565.1 hypothetical protein HBH53_062650 [Parastagonospora nodorum]KAH3975585.1 hypothetical protein HBH52_124200 [Parastagonospora nodorum]KAH3978975.1 hypothetical protein HBH51_061140 [Parastagonospora nodorum]
MRLAVLVALHLRGSAFGNNSCGKSNSQAISYDHRWAPAFFLIVLCASSRLAGSERRRTMYGDRQGGVVVNLIIVAVRFRAEVILDCSQPGRRWLAL